MCQSWVFGLIWPLNRLPHLKLPSQSTGPPKQSMGPPIRMQGWESVCFLFGMALFSRGRGSGTQKINPKTQLWHIWPNNNNNHIYLIPEYETFDSNVENEPII